MTAGNSTPLTDGASAVLLASEEWAAEHRLTPLAWFVDAETAAVDYVHGDEGLLMAPAYAVPRLLARNGLTLQDFDFYEIHEAFAATVLTTLKAWEDPDFCRERLGLDAPLGSIDRSRLNVNGSSLAAGHPFAATGGRIVASLAKQAQGGRRGPWPHLHLRCRWAGRRRDPGGVSMTDLFSTIVRSPVARKVGVPQPTRLRRYEPGMPLCEGPVLVAGGGRFADGVAAWLGGAGVAAVSTLPDAGEKVGAVVLDLSAAVDPAGSSTACACSAPRPSRRSDATVASSSSAPTPRR